MFLTRTLLNKCVCVFMENNRTTTSGFNDELAIANIFVRPPVVLPLKLYPLD